MIVELETGQVVETSSVKAVGSIVKYPDPMFFEIIGVGYVLKVHCPFDEALHMDKLYELGFLKPEHMVKHTDTQQEYAEKRKQRTVALHAYFEDMRKRTIKLIFNT